MGLPYCWSFWHEISEVWIFKILFFLFFNSYFYIACSSIGSVSCLNFSLDILYSYDGQYLPVFNNWHLFPHIFSFDFIFLLFLLFILYVLQALSVVFSYSLQAFNLAIVSEFFSLFLMFPKFGHHVFEYFSCI